MLDELTKPAVLNVITKLPEKYLLLNKETGEVWQGTRLGNTWSKSHMIDVKDFMYKHQKPTLL